MFNDKLDLVGVFDGHNGADVAQFAASQLPRLVERQLKKNLNSPKALVAVRLVSSSTSRDSFLCWQQAFLEANKLIANKGIKGGSTALLALFGDSAIHFANAGDSRHPPNPLSDHILNVAPLLESLGLCLLTKVRRCELRRIIAQSNPTSESASRQQVAPSSRRRRAMVSLPSLF